MQIIDIKWEEVVEMRKSKIAVLQIIGWSTEDEDETEIKTVKMMNEENKKEQGRGASVRGGNGYGNARGRSDHRNRGREYKTTGACHAWADTQRCRFGDECRFEHAKSDNIRKIENDKGHKKG